MSIELTCNPAQKPTVELQNEWGDKRVFKVDLQLINTPVDGDYEIVMSAIQGFVGKKEGEVTEHCEDPGVTEMYFPLSGQFQAKKGGKTYDLAGPFSDLTMLVPKGTLDLSSSDKPVLTVKDKFGKEYRIEGFVIPPETKHGTEHIPLSDTLCRFVAIKIKRRSQEKDQTE